MNSSNGKQSKKKQKLFTDESDYERTRGNTLAWLRANKENNHELVKRRETQNELHLGHDERLDDGNSTKRKIPVCPSFSVKFHDFSSSQNHSEKTNKPYDYSVKASQDKMKASNLSATENI